MYYEVMELLHECFFFTWFLFLAIGLINFLTITWCASRVLDRINEISEGWDAEKAEAKRSINRLLARRGSR